jgi:hypothetical protein
MSDDDGPSIPARELFEPDDVIAQWVFQMCAVTEDLSVADALLYDALTRDDRASLIGYHYRQVRARLYEAKRPIITLDQREDIRAWVDSLPDIDAPLGTLRAAYLPADASVVDRLYELARHRTVHFSWVNGDELRDTLAAASDTQCWVTLNHDDGTAHFDFAEAVMTAALAGDLAHDDDLADFTERARLAKAIVLAFGEVSLAALGHYCDARGIDTRRFVRQIPAGGSGQRPQRRRR